MKQAYYFNVRVSQPQVFPRGISALGLMNTFQVFPGTFLKCECENRPMSVRAVTG